MLKNRDLGNKYLVLCKRRHGDEGKWHTCLHRLVLTVIAAQDVGYTNIKLKKMQKKFTRMLLGLEGSGYTVTLDRL